MPDHIRLIVIANYFTKWMEAFANREKCVDNVADVLVQVIFCQFGIHLYPYMFC